MVSREIGIVRVVFSPDTDIPLIGWSGSFVAKLVYDIFKKCGIEFRRKEPKPFSITPLRIVKKDGEETIWSGLCEGEHCRRYIMHANKRYSFTVVMHDAQLAIKFIEGLHDHEHLNIRPIEIAYNSVKIGLRIRNVSTKRVKAMIELSFETPTHFIHRSWEVLYPSDKRLLYSLGKTLYNLTKINLKAYIERVMARSIELLDQRTRVVSVKIGERKIVPGFMGRAKYGVYLKEYEFYILKELLKLGELVGVGRNRALGFGRMKIINIEEYP